MRIWAKRGQLAGQEALRLLLGAVYQARRGECPPWMLRALSIQTPENHPAFATLARLLDRIDPASWAIVECGVYRGGSLLGLLHRLYRRGVPHATVYGFDSFQGFPAPTPEDAQPDGAFHRVAARGVHGNTSQRLVEWRLGAMPWPYAVHLVPG